MRNTFANEILRLAKERKDIVLLSGDIGNRMFDKFKEFDIYFGLAVKYKNDKSIWYRNKDQINKNIKKYLDSDFAKLTNKQKEIEDICLAAVKNIKTDPKRLFTVDDKKLLISESKSNSKGHYPCMDCSNNFSASSIS